MQLLILAAIALPLGLWLFFSAFGRLRLRLAVMDTPTSKIKSAAMGKCELKGLGRVLGQPLSAPFSAKPCIWYRWLVEEEHSDSKGNKSWSTIGQGCSEQAFLLDDLSASVLVQPSGAEVDAPKLFEATTGGLFGSKPDLSGPLAAQYAGGFFSSRRRFSEWRLTPGLPLYVLGMLRPVEGSSYVGRGRDDEPFLISMKSEAELLDSLFWGVWGRMVGGALLAIASAAFLVSSLVTF